MDPNWDLVNDFRSARGRLRLGPYERYLAEHIAARVAVLLGDNGDRGIAWGASSVADGEASPDSTPAGARANEPAS